MVNLSDMESLTTAEAAEGAGLTVRQWHYWTDKLGIEHTRQLAGPRGPKFWSPKAVATVARHVSEAA